MPEDLTTTCWTCDVVSSYLVLIEGFVNEVARALQRPMSMLFASLVALWMVIAGLKFSLQLISGWTLFVEFMLITVSGILLTAFSEPLIISVYTTALDVMGGASESIFAIADKSGGATEPGLVGLVARAEKAVAKVFLVAENIIDQASWTDVMAYVIAILLVVPYFLLVVVYAAQIIVAVFRVFMIGVFAPLLLMAYAFGMGRQMAYSGVKTLLSSIMVLYAATAALALAIYGAGKINPDLIVQEGMASIANPDVLVVLFLGIAGTALIFEATSIANSIVGSALSNTAAGIMTAGVSGNGALAMKLGGGAPLKGIGQMLGANAAHHARSAGILPADGTPVATHLAQRAIDYVKEFNGANRAQD